MVTLRGAPRSSWERRPRQSPQPSAVRRKRGEHARAPTRQVMSAEGQWLCVLTSCPCPAPEAQYGVGLPSSFNSAPFPASCLIQLAYACPEDGPPAVISQARAPAFRFRTRLAVVLGAARPNALRSPSGLLPPCG
jgi:hypothetical protein